MPREDSARGGKPSGAKLAAIAAGADAMLADYRRYPACRLQLVCAMCGWARSYSPERITARLQELRVGGHRTPLADVAARVAWPCPGCGQVRWRAELVWPPELDAREVRRLANLYRN